MPVGYSSRSLAEKLGLKSGMNVYFGDLPPSVKPILKLPDGVNVLTALLRDPADLIHFFSTRKRELAKQFPLLKSALGPDGMLWISWPKRAAKMETDLDENSVRKIGLANGLVDVKVISVDDVWSGLKFVYRVKDR
jgi:hypothetical protein